MRSRLHLKVAIQLGDMVSVKERKCPRHLWRLGKVTRLIRGRDGQNRSAVVRVQSGSGKDGTERNRSVQRLYSIEVSSDQKDNKELIRSSISSNLSGVVVLL